MHLVIEGRGWFGQWTPLQELKTPLKSPNGFLQFLTSLSALFAHILDAFTFSFFHHNACTCPSSPPSSHAFLDKFPSSPCISLALQFLWVPHGFQYPFYNPLFLSSFILHLLHNIHFHLNFLQCFLPSALPFRFSLFPTPLLSLLIIFTNSLNGSRKNSRMISNGPLPSTGPFLVSFCSHVHKMLVFLPLNQLFFCSVDAKFERIF